VLAALCVLDAPIMTAYREFRQRESPAPDRVAKIEWGGGADEAVEVSAVSGMHGRTTRRIPLSEDQSVTVYAEGGRQDPLAHAVGGVILNRTFWRFFEQFGLVYAWLLIGVFLWIYDAPQRRRVLLLALSLAISAVVVWYVQRMVGKLRPHTTLGAPVFVPFPGGWGRGGLCFPSGHTACAFAGATVLALTYPRAAWLFYVAAAGTALSRLVFLAHWPSDVYAGALVGCGVARALAARFPVLERRLLAILPPGLRRRFEGVSSAGSY
jgi:undecaprenyl-diphosphatase